MRRALRTGRAGTWGPGLFVAFGVGMIGSGVFRADPAFGFPPGTPAGKPVTTRWHGGLHDTITSLTFVVLIAAFFVLARRFGADDQPGWATATRVIAGLLIIATAAIGVAPEKAPATVFPITTALLSFLWVSALRAHLSATHAETLADTPAERVPIRIQPRTKPRTRPGTGAATNRRTTSPIPRPRDSGRRV